MRDGRLCDELRSAGTHAATGGGGVRLSPHGCTSGEERDGLLDVVGRAATP